MKRVFILIFISQICFCQTRKTDSLSFVIETVKSFSVSTNTIKSENGEYFIRNTKPDQSINKEISFLEQNLNEIEIEKLITKKNATFNAIGLIIFARRNNSKQKLLTKLDEIINYDCAFLDLARTEPDTIETIPDFFYSLIRGDEIFFKPEFKFDESELQNLDKKLSNFYKKSCR